MSDPETVVRGHDLARLEARCERFRQAFERIRAEIERTVIGCPEVVQGTLVALCGGGHVLLEGVPGLGKTLLVKSMAAALGVSHSRIQCTPDLMPADITGTITLVETAHGRRDFAFQRGPLFSNLVHVDEINRATPKTQAALLEAMQERAVTVGGQTYQLEQPFFVLATQNPIEMEGTFPLPEAELDRFFFKLRLESPPLDTLVDILRLTTGAVVAAADKAATADELSELMTLPREVLVADDVYRRAARIVRATHPDAHEAPPLAKGSVRLGASPRAAQALILGGKVTALLAGRFNVAYADLDAVALPALRHRLLLTLEAEADGVEPDAVVRAALDQARKTS
ncbi:MAG TPA: AAA family ATPase [Methylomirabilota bacterium]|nr:AAA family ATPase [Methylomirabilota bacterium]